MASARPVDTVIFLDIDGAVSPLPYQEPEYHYVFPSPFVWAQPMVPVRLRVAEWLSQTSAKLVWSSSWSNAMSLTASLGAGPKEALNTVDGKGEAIGAWLAAHPEVRRVVVVDDDSFDIVFPDPDRAAGLELGRITPDPYQGITNEHLDAIDRFVLGDRL